MKLRFRVFVIVCSVLVLWVALFLYVFLDTPVPDEFPEDFKFKLMDGLMRLHGFLVKFTNNWDIWDKCLSLSYVHIYSNNSKRVSEMKFLKKHLHFSVLMTTELYFCSSYLDIFLIKKSPNLFWVLLYCDMAFYFIKSQYPWQQHLKKKSLFFQYLLINDLFFG